ncbi:type IV secretion system protein VirB10 [Povalibacter uvarum]|uniref:Type IV secretion system protein VirB10 n=1 Tax=Povalibacter uvarum TaxID=732238 RepID=A0A841HRU0_9GAMM|nr:type IV secretion system protein VirB10 [Povalibacter uvarum]MBB6095019.1 type IV secretion system protein VirB10 [Povalibacter uvarum]
MQSAGSIDANAETARADAGRENEADTVPGERGVASIHRTRSLQSRISSVLAAGLMAVLALGFLAWYYTQTFARQSRAEAVQVSRSRQQTQGEMALPPLGRVDPPVVEKVLGPPPDVPPTSTFALDRFHQHETPPYAASSGYVQAPSITPEHRAVDRRLSGPVLVTASRNAAPAGEQSGVDTAYAGDSRRLRADVPSAGRGGSALAALLQPTATPAVQAKVLPTQRLLLPKGAFLDCTLETAVDSSLPGMTTCVTATDTFGADGSVVLMERGTKLVGETRGDVRHGSARVYVLWTEARTPEGVVVPLASPGTDELGRAGLPGEVNRHFWERFGAAILVSVIDGAVQAAVQRSSNGDDTVIVNPSTSSDIMTEVLRSTINIPPTVTKPHGDRIAVLVARDLDFRSVYELRPAALSY